MMRQQLHIVIGQKSDKGAKEINQDFHGALIPDEPLLGSKGIAVALADGISSSDVSHIAAETAVKSFFTDYYCTSDAWSVKTSAQRVIAAANSWLNAQNRRGPHADDRDRGYVCTFSALVIKSTTAHIFHVGDACVSLVADRSLERLTEEHRIVLSSHESYLGRALGVNHNIEIDYIARPVKPGDTFVLMTDGVHEHVDALFITGAIRDHSTDLDTAASLIVDEALRRGSTDNLTVQIVRVDAIPLGDGGEAVEQSAQLPLPDVPEPRDILDGYRIIRKLHGSSRSHIFLASDIETGTTAALKVPSIDLRGNPAYLRQFMLEEWAARRIDNAHVLKACTPSRPRQSLYVTMEFIEGQTLRQWMTDNPEPGLESVRGIIEQVARGLQAFHRKEMLHQDLRPDNIMIDRTGTVKIIDFGSVSVAGVTEARAAATDGGVPGTHQYAAPEYFLGEAGTSQSDLFSLGVIAYEMLTGRLPYGTRMAAASTRGQQQKLVYDPAADEQLKIPLWVDFALQKAVQPDPALRYSELSELVAFLRTPDPDARMAKRPLLQRNPAAVWQGVCALLLLAHAVAYFYR
jgi:serine/threonine protein phosphatase PrpC